MGDDKGREIDTDREMDEADCGSPAGDNQVGAIISSGPQNWQILQHSGGYGDIPLSGTWKVPPDLDISEGIDVCARMVEEDSGLVILPWQAGSTAPDGTWRITLRGIPAGGLYRLETCLHQRINPDIEWSIRGDMRHHLGVGDVFLIAGQSNSAGYGKDVILDPAEKGVHLLKNNGKWDMASHPFNESSDTVHVVNREGGNPGSSPYLAFSRRLKTSLHYPIGLVQASLGGSSLAMWNPEEDGCLYRNAVQIVKSCGPVRGVLWYQGCSDTGEKESMTYLARFERMVSHFRNDLNQPDLPFLTVQLNRLTRGPAEDNGWGRLREAQRRAAKEIDGVYVVSTTDLSLSDLIHISSVGNLVLGERLAATALKNIYKNPLGYDAPDLIEVKKTGADELSLTFAPVSEKIYTYELSAAEIPFCFEDEAGVLTSQSCRLKDPDTLLFRLDRPIQGECFVSGASAQNPTGITPVDFATHCPVLSFYRAAVLE